MTSNVSYSQALEKEKRTGRIAFVIWAAITLIGPFVTTTGGWRIAWFIVVVIYILTLFKHYNQNAIRHRAYKRSDLKS